MSQNLPPIGVRFEVDTSGLRKVADAAENIGPTLNGKLSTAGIVGGTFLGNALSDVTRMAMRNVTDIISGGFDEAMQMERLTKQTEARIAQTGNAAGVSSEQMKELASSIETVSGAQLDELQVLNSENVLATFTSIKNTVGEGNDIFTQATKTAANMSAVLGQDMQSSATQLGKALNDPIAGMSALGRVGVQFTDAQKEQIKQFVEAGDTLSAQKVILGELTTEFGGATEALGNTTQGKIGLAMDKIKDSVRDMAAEVLPQFAELANVFAQKIVPVINDAMPVIKAVVGFLTDHLSEIAQLITFIGIFAAVLKVATAVQTAFNIVMAMDPIVLVVLAIAALVAGIIYLATQTTFFTDLWKNLGDMFNAVFTGISTWAGEAWGNILNFFQGIFTWFGQLGSFLYNAAATAWGMFVKGALDVLFFLPGAVADILSTIPGLDGIGAGMKQGIANIKASVTQVATGSAGGGTTVNNYNVQAQGLTVGQVQQDATRRSRIAAPVGGY